LASSSKLLGTIPVSPCLRVSVSPRLPLFPSPSPREWSCGPEAISGQCRPQSGKETLL
jgi:hypothetical protein